MSKDKLIKLSKEEEEALLDNLRDYMSEEFDLDIGICLPSSYSIL